MRICSKLIRAGLSAVLLGSGAVQAYELRFQDGYTQNSTAIAKDYGSVAGVIDVSVEASNGANLLFWAGDYSGNAAAYANTSVGIITLTPLAGATVTLDSFFLGGWLNTDRNIRYIVDNLATAGIDIEVNPAFVSGTNGLSVAPGLSSAQGIRITFGPDGYNGGINNIVFSVSAVPEPKSGLMLLAGIGLIGCAARRAARAVGA